MSAEGIQQILVELQKLNRRMDTLNTRLFGNPEGDAGDEGRLAPTCRGKLRERVVVRPAAAGSPPRACRGAI